MATEDRQKFLSNNTDLYENSSEVTVSSPNPNEEYKRYEEYLFWPGLDNSEFYRIPAVIKTQAGTVIAGIDKRQTTQADNGNIAASVRRREAGQESFDDPITLIDLYSPENHEGPHYPFMIDMAMVQITKGENAGRIVMLMDHFPECSGTWDANIGHGHVEVDGKFYQGLYDGAWDAKTQSEAGNEYTIREEGKVYDSNGELTEYTVQVEDEMPYSRLGMLYKNGEEVGNIYMSDSELHVFRTMYIWMTYSDDDGKTWSLPKDITPQVKEDYMNFYGVSPGKGTEFVSGRIAFPVYQWSEGEGTSESAKLVYSDDGGETWHAGETTNDRGEMSAKVGNFPVSEKTSEAEVIQLNDGTVIMVARTEDQYYKYAISHDEGETWEDDVVNLDFKISSANCMSSIVKYDGDLDGDGITEEYLIMTYPEGKDKETYGPWTREHGVVSVGRFNEDHSIEWLSTKPINFGGYSYSCIELIDEENGVFGLLYETGNPDFEHHVTANYTEFNLKWLMS